VWALEYIILNNKLGKQWNKAFFIKKRNWILDLKEEKICRTKIMKMALLTVLNGLPK
jgi:hypothetical protein